MLFRYCRTTETENANTYVLTFQGDKQICNSCTNKSARPWNRIARICCPNVKYSVPATLWTDEGANLLSEIFENVCKLLRIKKIQTVAFHPEWNGGLERSYRVLTEYIRHYTREDQRNLDHWIPCATFVYNITEHVSTGYSHFELVFGYKPRYPQLC